jgi:hypothetical protein
MEPTRCTFGPYGHGAKTGSKLPRSPPEVHPSISIYTYTICCGATWSLLAFQVALPGVVSMAGPFRFFFVPKRLL